jgi:D-aminoacyl-tRNA deacylase
MQNKQADKHINSMEVVVVPSIYIHTFLFLINALLLPVQILKPLLFSVLSICVGMDKAKITNSCRRYGLTDNCVIVTSGHDLAGTTMSNYLIRKAEFTIGSNREGDNDGNSYRSLRHQNIQLHIFYGNLLTLENIENLYPRADIFIFLSKHRSNSSVPTLTCHFPGNFSAANPYGGNPRQIAISYPSLQKGYLKAITAAKHKVPGYDIVIEATHHGPTSLNKPVLFVELGSSEEQWADENAAAVICDTLLDILQSGFERYEKIGIGLGGTHYPKKFNKLLLESEFGLAAIASKYNLGAIDEAMLNQMIDKSIEKVTYIVIDSKGLGRDKDRILKLVEQTPLKLYKL